MNPKTEPIGAVQVYAAIVAIVLIINILMFAFGKISIRTFWLIIIAAAVIAYFVLPKLRKK